LKAYVLVAPKKCKKLNERAVDGLVVGHLEESKGWKLWNCYSVRKELEKGNSQPH
jgi:hypothetical protein